MYAPEVFVDRPYKALDKILNSFEPASTGRCRNPMEGESRKIAVLAMTIGGFESTGPELERNTLKRFTELIISELSSCVSICGGEFQRTGKREVIALFGTGKEAEQACRRAVDSGFRMMKTIEMINRSIEKEETLLRFTGMVGIAWGQAAVTVSANGNTHVEGKCVQKALNLMSKTIGNVILVSDQAKSTCGDFFSWDAFPYPADEKIWIPVAEQNRVSVHPLLEGVPLLGREREMDHLRSSWKSCRKWFNHPPVLVLGKPGIGKTRLIDSFLNEITEPGVQIVRLINRLWDQPPLGMWLPLMDKGTFDPYGTVMARIRNLHRESALIICVEDLHWADEASLKLLDQIARAMCDTGVFLILSSRSEPEGNISSISERLSIQGLDYKSVKALLESMIGKAEGSESARFTDFLMERAAGNPLLVIELILHSMETKTIGRDSRGYWFIDREPEQIIPHSAESFLQARMSTLKPQERFALQIASALGNGFSEKHFMEIFQRLGYESGSIVLSRLQNMGFLVSPSNSVYHFSNSILSGTVYRTIIRENRVLIHKTAAEVLSSNQSGSAIAMARHWIESESGSQAVPWLFKALHQCLDLGEVIRAETLSRELHSRIPADRQNPESLNLEFLDARLFILMGRFQAAYDQVSRLIPELEGSRLAMAYFILGQSTENLGMQLQEGVKYYIKAAEEAELSGDLNVRVQALSAAGALYLATGKKNLALESFNSALEHTDALDSPSLAKLHGNIGILMHRTGSHEEALKHYQKTLELGRKCGNLGIEANALAFIGQVQINMGMREEGLERYREALAIHRKAGNRRGECITLGNLGGQLARFGETDGAIDMLERAIGIAEVIGHTRGIMSFHSNLGLAFKMSGQYEKAEKHIRTAIEMIGRSGDKRAMAVAHLNLCTVLSRMIRLTEAVDEARRALRFACAVNALTTQARALGNLGWLMLKTDKLELALNFFREAFRRSYLAEDHSMLADSKTGEAVANRDIGKTEEARACLKEALELKETYGMDFESLETLEELRISLGETDEQDI